MNISSNQLKNSKISKVSTPSNNTSKISKKYRSESILKKSDSFTRSKLASQRLVSSTNKTQVYGIEERKKINDNIINLNQSKITTKEDFNGKSQSNGI